MALLCGIGHQQTLSKLRGPVPPVGRSSKSYCLFLVRTRTILSTWLLVSRAVVFPWVSKTVLGWLSCFSVFSACAGRSISSLLYVAASCLGLSGSTNLRYWWRQVTEYLGWYSKHWAPICKSLDPIGKIFRCLPSFGTVQQDSFHVSVDFRLICFYFQTGLRRRNTVLALPILAFISCSYPPSTTITLSK